MVGMSGYHHPKQTEEALRKTEKQPPREGSPLPSRTRSTTLWKLLPLTPPAK